MIARLLRSIIKREPRVTIEQVVTAVADDVAALWREQLKEIIELVHQKHAAEIALLHLEIQKLRHVAPPVVDAGVLAAMREREQPGVSVH